MTGESELKKATFGGGCFWCLEAVYREVEGVARATSGYAGGHTSNPTYREVCGGRTGHAEVVQLEYDPAVIDFRTLLDIFFTIHDPTQKDRQGNDVGTQYRSIIFWHDDEQQQAAAAAIERLDHAGDFDAPVVTELAPLERFYPAEHYHDDYFRNNPQQPYCQMVVAPKLAKARARFADRLRR